jgi:IS5 family transposase
LVHEVSDSLHLRRFCLIAIDQRVPCESAVRKLTKRLGPDVVDELSRLLIQKAQRETRFRARAVRIDSTVVEADVRYPNDTGLAQDAARILARAGRKAAAVTPTGGRVRDRSTAIGKRLREIGRTIKRRTGRAKEEVLDLTGQAGEILEQSVRESRRLAQRVRASARGRGARRKLRVAQQLDQAIERSEKVARQIRQRLAGEKITDRIVSLADPDARPIRKGKLKAPTQFGYVHQITEVTPNTRRGARGFVLPTKTAPGNPGEEKLLPAAVEELRALDLRPREVALDGGFPTRSTEAELEPLQLDRTYIAGRRRDWSRKTTRRLARYRTGAEGRISHLKRSYGFDRSRLKGATGARTWTGWATLAYNLDTYRTYA